MMGKISTQEIVNILTERRQLSKKQASQFVNEMFHVIQKSLDEEKLVKVKGLGTFRIIDVEDRESVNVNTGDRVLIEGHGKITFTPDALMKELVNKPFSQFETVVLNEGVDFGDATDVEEPAPVDEPAEPVVMDEPATVDEPAEPVIVADPIDNPSQAPLVDFVTDSEVPGEVAADDTASKIEDAPQEEPADEVTDYESEPEHRRWLWPVVAVAACAIGFVAGYFVGKESGVTPWTPEETIVDASVAVKPQDSTQFNPKKDTAALAVHPDTMPRPAKQDTPIKSVDAPTKSAEGSVNTPTVPSESSASSAAQQVESPDKYEQMDIRIRTGAYRIVGLDHTERVRPGDNLARICKRTLGPGMECYLEVYNGIKGDADLKSGHEIKIPKLQWKRKKTQK